MANRIHEFSVIMMQPTSQRKRWHDKSNSIDHKKTVERDATAKLERMITKDVNCSVNKSTV